MSKFITILDFTLYIITFSKMRKEVTVEIGPTSTVSNEHDSKSLFRLQLVRTTFQELIMCDREPGYLAAWLEPGHFLEGFHC